MSTSTTRQHNSYEAKLYWEDITCNFWTDDAFYVALEMSAATEMDKKSVENLHNVGYHVDENTRKTSKVKHHDKGR